MTEQKLRLIHSTNGLESAVRILKQGIQSPKVTGVGISYSCSVPDKIFLLVKQCSAKTVWGDYHFVLDNDYVKAFSHQFRVHADLDSDNAFEFAERFGIKPYEGNFCMSAYDQIISLSSIPVGGLRELAVESLTEEERRVIEEVLPEHMKISKI
jgi:hypothetical protein